MSELLKIQEADLAAAKAGSWYFIAGCGGDLQEWVEGYTKELQEAEIGTPKQWFQTTGAAVNTFKGMSYGDRDAFDPTLTCLLFPLDGLDVGRLAMFKLRWQDRWFDDVLANMKPGVK